LRGDFRLDARVGEIVIGEQVILVRHVDGMGASVFSGFVEGLVGYFEED
jgi:hypothetical protein